MHEFLNPDSLMPGVGFSHIAVPAAGQTIYFAGQTAHARGGELHGDTVGEQAYAALANLATALRSVGAKPEHLVAMQIFVTDVAAYRAQLTSIGKAWQTHLGKHFPTVSLFGVTELFDPKALIEILATAVIPDVNP